MTWILHQGVRAFINNIPSGCNDPHAQTAKAISLPQKQYPPQKRQGQHSRTCSFHAVRWNQATAPTFLTQREWGQKQGYYLPSLSSLKEKGQSKRRLHKLWYPTTACAEMCAGTSHCTSNIPRGATCTGNPAFQENGHIVVCPHYRQPFHSAVQKGWATLCYTKFCVTSRLFSAI